MKELYLKSLVGVFLLSSVMAAQAQPRTVTGTVTDAQTSLPGVNILIKGTNTGTISDFDGNYSIQVADATTVLVFSFVGYTSQEIEVGQQSVIDVELASSINQLAEIIVVGYSEKTRGEITGAVINLSSDKMEGVTGSSLEYMLQGKVAGLQVSTSTGAPGAPAEIRIRGNSSINADRGPLIVVDGIIGGSYNPNDVESITVLKDVGAIAMYGSRANSGVIVVTTKHGETGKPQISYNGTVGIRNITTGQFELMGSEELYTTERAMFASSAQFLALRPASLKETNIDWLGLAYKQGIVQNHNISVSGGSDKLKYYVAGDFYDEEGTLLTTKYERFNFRTNLEYQLSEKVGLSTAINITRDQTGSYHWRWPYQPFLYLPYDTPYDADGNIRYVDGNTPGFLSRDKNNILHSALYNTYDNHGLTLNTDAVLTIDMAPWLTFQSRNRLEYSSNRNDTYEDSRTIEGRANNGILTFDVSDGYSVITTNLFRLSKEFNRHHVGGLIGFEGQSFVTENAGAAGYGIVSGIKAPGAIASPQAVSGTRLEVAALSILSEFNYNLDAKYFFSASFRRDGSSKFGSNKRWGNFGAVSASWILSKEDFFSSLAPFVSSMKLRGSYGVVGNDNLPPFQFLAKYNFATQYNGGSAGYAETIPNPDLGWEQTKSSDIGLDATLKNNIDVTVDYFTKNTDNLLLKVQLPPSQGITEVWKNAGRVVNHGIEVGISGNVLRSSALTWNVGFNIGTAKNEVKELAPSTPAVNRDYDGVKQSVQVGYDINTWYLPKWVGVDPANGDPLWESAVMDNSGNITGYEVTNLYSSASATSSLQMVASATPKFFGGLNTTLDYKAFSLSVSTSYVYGNQIYHRTREFIDADGALFNFNMMRLADGWSRWQQPGDVATHPKPVFGGNQLSNKPSSRYLEDGSYWRIRNIRLNYSLPGALLEKINLTSANIYISGDNLFTFTKFSGMDPDVQSFGLMGMSDFRYPISKQYLVGVQLTF